MGLSSTFLAPVKVLYLNPLKKAIDWVRATDAGRAVAKLIGAVKAMPQIGRSLNDQKLSVWPAL